jgi:hypothetical protein
MAMLEVTAALRSRDAGSSFERGDVNLRSGLDDDEE